MIALIATLLFVLYVLVPATIFRFVTALTVPLKKFHRTKTQEITFAVVASLLPFAVTLVLVWTIASVPFRTGSSYLQRRHDYRTVVAAISSDKQLDDELKSEIFWPAFNSVLRRQTRFLFWYYLLTILEGWLFGKLVSRYAKLKDGWFYSSLAQHFLLPSVSEWHLILTDFGIPTDIAREVQVDVLSTERILYRGKVGDYFLDAEGNLSGMLLSDPERFDRDLLLHHRHEDHLLSMKDGVPQKRFTRPLGQYWRKIPSASLYLPNENIANLNVRHEPIAITQAINERLQGQGIQVAEMDGAPHQSYGAE